MRKLFKNLRLKVMKTMFVTLSSYRQMSRLQEEKKKLRGPGLRAPPSKFRGSTALKNSLSSPFGTLADAIEFSINCKQFIYSPRNSLKAGESRQHNFHAETPHIRRGDHYSRVSSFHAHGNFRVCSRARLSTIPEEKTACSQVTRNAKDNLATST